MSGLAKLTKIGSSTKPYYGFTKLTIGYHKIQSFRIVKNKFAKETDEGEKKTLLAELEDQIIFLPKYFMDALNRQDIQELNNVSNETYYLFFGGKRERNQYVYSCF